ncbi:TDRD5 protein, partial [Eurystomus gularis]|nr:TDRD5 protein [Eurystomus gularis]
MSKQAQSVEVLKKEVRSPLMDAEDGLTPAQLEQEYMAVTSNPLSLHDMGLQSTLELVADRPQVVRVCPYEKSTYVLKGIFVRFASCIQFRKGSNFPYGYTRTGKNCFSCTCRIQEEPKPGMGPLRKQLSQAFLGKIHFSIILVICLTISRLTRASGFCFVFTYEYIEECIVSESSWWLQIIVFAAAPAGEMPPLEPICETEIFHLTAEEKSEPVETQAVGLGDGLKQRRKETSESHLPLIPLKRQELEQSLLAKLILTPEIPPDAVQDRNLCSLPPLERKCMVGVSVGFIVSPSQFYIRIYRKENPNELQDMMFEMRYLYSHKLVSDRYVMPESSVRPGQLCCVTVANWWYRVIIHRVINDQEVEVFYADYGNLEIVRKSWLRFLKWCYLKLPAQAIPCSLARVKPVERTWSRRATLLFKELCGSNVLVGIVDEYVNGILHLFLCNTSTKEDIYFHRVLTDGGYADSCEENIPSQGFIELNPSALCVPCVPSGQQKRAELMEPALHVQQESLNAASEMASLKMDGIEVHDQQWHLPAKEETQNDLQPLLDEASVPRTADQDPELTQEDTNEASAELVVVAETPHSLRESSTPAVLLKSVEDFDTSFFYSKQPAETSHDDPHQREAFSNETEYPEALHPAVLLMAVKFAPDKGNNEERMKNEDLPRSTAAGLCSASGVSDHKPSQKLYIPPTTLSAVMPSAHLASSSGQFQW